jgi:hypothetical protein
MRRTLCVAAMLIAVLLVACEVSPKDTIVGTWAEEGSDLELKINADGTIIELEGGEIDNEGTWKLSDKAPWILSIYEDGELEVEVQVKIINNNEVELSAEGETIKMKRK